MWVIYENPSDHPGKWIARKWVDSRPTREYLEEDSLHRLRGLLPRGLDRLPRTVFDDPVIKEVWL